MHKAKYDRQISEKKGTIKYHYGQYTTHTDRMRQQQQQAAASRLVKSNVDLTHRCFDPVPLQLVPTRYGLNASSADCSASWHVRIEPGWVGWPSYLNDTVNWLDFVAAFL